MTPTSAPLSLLIVVPTLNSHTLLPRLLDSLQQQTWQPWQLLFVDGGSGPEHRRWLARCCAAEPRCRWLDQDPAEPGIYGAMNQGFAAAGPADWLLFWGSDDWAASPTVLSQAIRALECMAKIYGLPDLLVCSGRYAAASTGQLGRRSIFRPGGRCTAAAFRRSLLLGSTPPHQATLIGPKARRRLARYAPGYRLAADLDYFLQLSRQADLKVACLPLQLVHMEAGGISSQQHQLRLQEVRRAYRHAFAAWWWIPFLARYLQRLTSLLAPR